MLLSSMSGEKRTSFLGAEAPVWAHSAGTRTTQTAKNFGKERMDILESRCRSQKCTVSSVGRTLLSDKSINRKHFCVLGKAISLEILVGQECPTHTSFNNQNTLT